MVCHRARRIRRIRRISEFWEPACGEGDIAEALKCAGAASVYATDIIDRGYRGFTRKLDFLTATAMPPDIDVTVTNPPGGPQNITAVKFIETALRLMRGTELLCLLLPVDFDSGVTRWHLFGNCPAWLGKIVLTDRPKWWDAPGNKNDPKEDYSWYLWSHANNDVPRLRYAKTMGPKRTKKYGVLL